MGVNGLTTIRYREHPSAGDFFMSHSAWFDQDSMRLTCELLPGKTDEARVVALHLKPRTDMTAIATALEHGHISGNTEPWIQDIVIALLKGLQRDKPMVLECGGFMGSTSAKLATALNDLGGGDLIIAEWDPEAPERADKVQEALERTPCGLVRWTVRREDACSVIRSLADESVDYAFLDDDHSHAHVDEELRLLLPKMRVGGIITGHDVYGSCDLQQEFLRYGGYALDLPRLGAAGGVGILQIR